MKKYLFPLLISLAFVGQAQVKNTVVQGCINQTDLSLLKKMMDEFTGEVSTTVGGQQVMIKNRVSSSGNNIAADYIKEKLISYGLTPVEQNYSSGGRNVYAIQKGKVTPDNIYIISGHYDAVANFCADDNASGTLTVLEAARILSKQTFENTIIYALWDEEETGLKGSTYFASTTANNMNIKSVMNIDMNGYDGNGDNAFDVDYRNVAQSPAQKDLVVGLLPLYNFNLTCHPVISKKDDSDHAPFLNRGITCIFLGECWDKNDVTPYYHTANDKANTIVWNYYHNLVKVAIAYIATVAVPLSNGVQDKLFSEKVTLYPNPAQSEFTIGLDRAAPEVTIEVSDAAGRIIFSSRSSNTQSIPVDLKAAAGMYFVKVRTNEGQAVFKLMKQE